MAIIADVPAVHSGDNQARALFTLSVLTGYKAAGANRVIRAINTVIHAGRLQERTAR